MRNVLGAALITLGALATSAMAEDTLYLNCKCQTITNSALSTQPSCSTTADFLAIIDLDKSTIDLKSAGTWLGNGLSGPAAISPGSIRASWNMPGANLPKKSLNIDRLSGAYSFSWSNDAPTELRWTGMCVKAAAPKTQF